MDELKESVVRFEDLDGCQGDLEAVERFMAQYASTEKEWKTRLTQSQDVIEWVKSPALIDRAIVWNLDEFVTRLRGSEDWNLSLLDVGCYAGYLRDFLMSSGFNDEYLSYTGIDIRPEVVARAKELHEFKSAFFTVGSVFDLKRKVSEGNHDIVFCSRVLIHLPRFEEAVENLVHAADDFVYIVTRVTPVGSCLLRRKIDETRKETMTYFYRTVSLEDVRQVALRCNTNHAIVGMDKPYQSIVLSKR